MQVVAGLSIKNLKPRVWDPDSPDYLPGLGAVMVSYAEFVALPARRKAAMDRGLHDALCIPTRVKIYLDNGAFYFLTRDGTRPGKDFAEFVENAKPDWYPIPTEYIPHPGMTAKKQLECFEETMKVNRAYSYDGFVPVVHAGRLLPRYVEEVEACEKLAAKKTLALGGMVPNLLRSPKALPYPEVLGALANVRQRFRKRKLHVFGMGGTATLHIAALLGFDSVDSSGWRNRAARGIVQLPGSGDRMVTNLGSWRGREPDKQEMVKLRNCECPACDRDGLKGLKASGVVGFAHRATHNLWVLLEEAKWIEERFDRGTYWSTYKRRLDNTTYAPLIEQVARIRFKDEQPEIPLFPEELCLTARSRLASPKPMSSKRSESSAKESPTTSVRRRAGTSSTKVKATRQRR